MRLKKDPNFFHEMMKWIVSKSSYPSPFWFFLIDWFKCFAILDLNFFEMMRCFSNHPILRRLDFFWRANTRSEAKQSFALFLLSQQGNISKRTSKIHPSSSYNIHPSSLLSSSSSIHHEILSQSTYFINFFSRKNNNSNITNYQ